MVSNAGTAKWVAFVIVALAAYPVEGAELGLQFKADSGGLYKSAQDTIRSTGRSCTKVEEMFVVTQGGSSETIFKAVCSGSREYQITIFGKRVFVKEWTGNLLGR
jgi:hypothetical protein